MVRNVALLLAALAALVRMTDPAGAQARVATNLNTHSEVVIDRPAAVIWPHIIDPNGWKRAAKLWHHAGPVGQVGEIFAAGDPADRTTVMFLAENVELAPGQRRTIKIYLPQGTLLGFATWTLREEGGRTVVGYDVHSESLLEPAQAGALTADQIREAERSSQETSQKRFDEELLDLKRLVETGR